MSRSNEQITAPKHGALQNVEKVDAVEGGVTLPDADWILSAKYLHVDGHLALVSPDTQSMILVKDFFNLDTPPNLQLAGGAQLPGNVVSQLAGPRAPGQYVQNGEEVAAASPIGVVETIQGGVTAKHVDGTIAELSSGSPVYAGDVIETGQKGAVGITFADESTLALDGDATLTLDDMVYDPGGQDGSATMFLVKGAMSFVSGQIAKVSPDAMVINTPIATIGIRGTAAAVNVDPEGGGTETVLLAEQGSGPNGLQTGEIILGVGGQTVTINTPYGSSGAQPGGGLSEVRTVSLDEVGTRFGTTLSNLPNAVQALPAGFRNAVQKVVAREQAKAEAEEAQQEAEEAQAEAEAAAAEAEAKAEAADEKAQEAEAADEAAAEAEAKAEQLAAEAEQAETQEQKEALQAEAEAAKAEAEAAKAEAEAAKAEAEQVAQEAAAAEEGARQAQAEAQAAEQQAAQADAQAQSAQAEAQSSISSFASSSGLDVGGPAPDAGGAQAGGDAGGQDGEPGDGGGDQGGDEGADAPDDGPIASPPPPPGPGTGVIGSSADDVLDFGEPIGGADEGPLDGPGDGDFGGPPDGQGGDDERTDGPPDGGGEENNLAPIFIGTSQKVMAFDGVDDYVDMPEYAINNMTTGTIEAWVYLNDVGDGSTPGSGATITRTQGDYVNTAAWFGVGLNDGNTNLTSSAGQVLFRPTNGVEAYSTGTIAANTWHHLAVSFNGTEAKLYIDGVLDSTHSGNYVIPDLPASSVNTGAGHVFAATVGGTHDGLYETEGQLGDIAVWNTVLTTAEVASSYANGITSSDGNLRWHMNFADGTATDHTGNGYDGTLIGAEGAASSVILLKEDGSFSGTFSADDPDGDIVAFFVDSGPSNGTATVNTDGTFTYVPDSNYNGSDSFVIEMRDGKGGVAAQSISVNVAAVNDAPTATAYSNSDVADLAQTFTLNDILAKASDVDSGDTLTLQSMAGQAVTSGTPWGSALNVTNGTLAFDGTTFTFTPTASYTGTESLAYVVSDGTTTSASTVDLTVATGTEWTVNTDTSGSQLATHIAALTDGGWVTVWQDQDKYENGGQNAYDIKGQIYNADGSARGNQLTIASGTSGQYPNSPSVVGLTGGDFVVVWNQDNPNMQRFDSTGSSVTTAVDISTGNNQIADSEIIGLSDGGYAIAYRIEGGAGGNYSDIYFQIYDSSNTQVLGETFVNNQLTQHQSFPDVAYSNGKYVIVWNETYAGATNTGILARVYDPSTPGFTSNEFALEAANYGERMPSIMTMTDGSNNLLMTWHDNSSINARIIDNTGATIKDIDIDTVSSPSVSENYTHAAGFSSGNFVVVWVTQGDDPSNTSSQGVYAQIFDSSGTAVSSSFRVNDVVAGSQRDPQVTVLSDDDFVVTWTSTDADGMGISSKRFNSDGTVDSTNIPSNSAPTFSAGATLAAVNEDTGSPSGDTVSALFGGQFVDADSNSMAGVVITADGSSGGEGTWEYSTDGGANWYAVGSVSTAAGLMLDSSSKLRFLPAADYSGNPGSLTAFAVDDSVAATFTSGATKQTFDTTADGATSNVSAAGASLVTTVTAVNDAPTDIALTASTIAENSVAATVGTLSATDIDSGDTATFTIVTDASGLFEISGTTLKLKAGVGADYEDATSHNITIRVTDSGGLTYDEVMTVSVSDMADPPTLSFNPDFAPTTMTDFVATARMRGADVGDIDGDGKLDLVYEQFVSADYAGNIMVSKGNGDGTFQTQSAVATNANQTNRLQLGDVDEDGDLDIADSAGKIYLNNGSGVYSDSGFAGIAGNNLLLADVNGDGKDDYIGLAGNQTNVYLNTNTVAGTFSFGASSWNVGTGGSSLNVGDFDGDGDNDLVIGVGATADIYANDGTGTFTFSSSLTTTGANINAIEVADFDGDGKDDLWLTTRYVASSVYMNDGDGNLTFTAGGALASGTVGVGSDVGDIDGDGDIDVVVSGGYSSEFWVNDGTGSFTNANSGNPFGSNTSWGYEVNLADFDGDGHLDAFITEEQDAGFVSQVFMSTIAKKFVVAGAAIEPFADLKISDIDSANLMGASIVVGSFQSGDVLNFTDQNGITGSYNAGTGVLTLSGTTTIANYQTAVQSISFNGATTLGDRAISVALTDAEGMTSSAFYNTVTVASTDPIVLDLDGDGIELVDVAAGVTFDIDNDGEKEATGWVGADDGLLVVDVNQNGSIDDMREVVSPDFEINDVKPAETDSSLDVLKKHDENDDGVIDVSDSIYELLQVWNDVNQNGISENGELKLLSDMGIEMINLGGEEEHTVVGGNIISETGTATTSEGNVVEWAEVTFAAPNPGYSTTESNDETAPLDAAQ